MNNDVISVLETTQHLSMNIKEVGRLIKAALKDQGIQQQKIADDLGVHRSVISAACQGTGQTSKATLDKIARYLGIEFSLSFPLEKTDKKQPDE